MKTVACIQARMASTRLPGKIAIDLNGLTVLERVARRVGRADSVDEVVIATTAARNCDIIELLAPADATVFRFEGDEGDVRERMYQAASEADADVVVRITSDCPLIDPETIDRAVSVLQSTDAEYVSNLEEPRTYPHGLDVEAFTMEGFDRARAESDTEADREHVTPWFRRSGDVPRKKLVAPEELDRDVRLTLDEAKDYKLLREVFESFLPAEYVDVRDALETIDRDGLAGINRDVVQKTA